MDSKFKLTTPILYLAWNRVDSIRKTFPEIQKAKPEKLFIACDGPRSAEEKRKTDAVRKYILKNINWKCEVKTLFRDENLGCRYAVSGAIDWFFENVPKGIILEDDCLPDSSFFRFCQEMLNKYDGNRKIMSIGGQNALGKFNTRESYFFSKYFFCWGWATWKDSWERRDIKMSWYRKYQKAKLKIILPSFFERLLYKKRFNDNLIGNTDSWAITFLLTHLKYNSIQILPRENLVENIGFSDSSSTHTSENRWDRMYSYCPRSRLNFPLSHPTKIARNTEFDRKYILQNYLRIILKKVS